MTITSDDSLQHASFHARVRQKSRTCRDPAVLGPGLRTFRASDRTDHSRQIANLRPSAVRPDHERVRMRLAWIASAAVTLASTPALAQNAGDAALAEKLFQDGRALMAAGDFAAACPKLAESERLDPGVGTLLNLGECYEKEGKAASAWATYREAEPMARRLGQRDRADFAAARAAALASTLAYLTVKIASQPRGLELTLDGTLIAAAAWTSPIPVDPGTHSVVLTAPGYHPWKTSVDVAKSARVDVPAPPLVRDETKPPAQADAGASPPSHAPLLRTLGWIGVGVGGAALVAGGVFGYLAKSKNDDAHADGHCTDVDCDARGQTLIGQAKDAALVSTIFVAAGGALTAAGVVLVVTTPGGAKVAIGPGGVGGTW
jgi:hypothetical protein